MSTTVEPKYSPSLCDATEAQLRAHDLRLKPGVDIEHVLDAVTGAGFKVEAAFGGLKLTQNLNGIDCPMHVSECIEAITKQRGEFFYPREVSGVTAKDQLDTEGKIKFLKERGLAEWEKLPSKSPAVEPPTVLDSRKMTRKQWQSLDLATRAKLSGLWGAATIGQIMARTK